jgi:hypothetical protein
MEDRITAIDRFALAFGLCPDLTGKQPAPQALLLGLAGSTRQSRIRRGRREAAEEGRKQEQAKADAAAAERQRQAEAAAEAQRQADLAAATPPPAPAGPPADDPIGAGGFITPPDQRDVVLCVQAGLIQLEHDSWNMPVIGGKMVTFQSFIGPYILSVAKPGWLYGIGDQAYARFNPAATADPASFVFAIPPGQQATPGSCPEDYSIFSLQKTGQIKCRGCE